MQYVYVSQEMRSISHHVPEQGLWEGAARGVCWHYFAWHGCVEQGLMFGTALVEQRGYHRERSDCCVQLDPQAYLNRRRQQEAKERGEFVDIHDIGNDPEEYDVLVRMSSMKHWKQRLPRK